jgi:hypothetical protein
MCNAIIKSGKRQGEFCMNRAHENGYCGVHRKQGSLEPVHNELFIINKSDRDVILEEYSQMQFTNELGEEDYDETYVFCKTVYKEQVLKVHIPDECLHYYYINQSVDNQEYLGFYLDPCELIKIGSVRQIIISNPPELSYDTEKKTKELWKNVAMKALKIPEEIKKLTTSDTVLELCSLVDYIDMPEEITQRDFQLAGATYNPDDEDIPLENQDSTLDLDITAVDLATLMTNVANSLPTPSVDTLP